MRDDRYRATAAGARGGGGGTCETSTCAAVFRIRSVVVDGRPTNADRRPAAGCGGVGVRRRLGRRAGLPDLYGEFDTTIVGVSWVLTIYALAVALAAVPVAAAAPAHPAPSSRARRCHLLRGGVDRCRCRRKSRRPARGASRPGRRRRAPAGRIASDPHGAGTRSRSGSSLVGDGRGDRGRDRPGPRRGLTEAFSWRAIFLVQAPIVAGAWAVVTVRPAVAPGIAALAPAIRRPNGRQAARRRRDRQRRVRARLRGAGGGAVPRRAHGGRGVAVPPGRSPHCW